MSTLPPVLSPANGVEYTDEELNATERVLPGMIKQLGTNLYRACLQNDVTRVQQIASQSATVDWKMAFIAAAAAKAKYVADFSLNSHDGPPSDTAGHAVAYLMMAANEDRIKVAQYLVEAGLINIDTYPEHCGTLLGFAVVQSRYDFAKYLLERGAKPGLSVALNRYLRIITCAAELSDTAMIELLLEHGAVLKGSQALIFAVRKGKLENAKILIARGADLNEVKEDRSLYPNPHKGATALHIAVEKGYLEVVDLLLQAGADVFIRDAEGKTPAEIAREHELDPKLISRLDGKAAKV